MIDTATGETTLIGSLGVSVDIRDIHFNAVGDLFGVVGDGDTEPDRLVSIDKTTGAATDIGLVGINYIMGLTSYCPPGAAGGRDIPEAFGQIDLLATQTCPTSLGDNADELNQLYLDTLEGSLHIGLTGSLEAAGLVLLVDSRAGGQSVLDLSGYSPPPFGPQELTGTTLDAGFEPDELLFVTVFAGSVYADRFELSPEGATKTFLGSSIVGSGCGVLSGGSNPAGVQVALDPSNTAGVTDTDASTAATATAGVEMVIPMEILGLEEATASIKLLAFLMQQTGEVSNQLLPGLNECDELGPAPDLASIAGDQFVEAPILPLVDGRNIPDDVGTLGELLGTQTCPTSLGDNVSELNQLFCRAAGDQLLVGLTGNLDGAGVALLVDTRGGGQNVLDLSGYTPPPFGPHELTRTILDAGFEPDEIVYLNEFDGVLFVDQFELLTAGGTIKTFRGQVDVDAGDGLLAGGSNPNDMRVAIDDSNLAGVTGDDASGAPPRRPAWRRASASWISGSNPGRMRSGWPRSSWKARETSRISGCPACPRAKRSEPRPISRRSPATSSRNSRFWRR